MHWYDQAKKTGVFKVLGAKNDVDGRGPLLPQKYKNFPKNRQKLP